MTDQFMNDPVLREKYGLAADATFDSAFSTVSLESIIFGIVAAAVHVLEVMFDIFRTEVDSKIATAVVASIPWYHKICLEYQHGDPLVLNETTGEYGYEQEDLTKRKVKFASCRDRGGGVYILVAGEGDDGLPKALSDDILLAFREYIGRRKPVGIVADIYSYDPDFISIGVKVQYDPLVLNADGSLISDPDRYPVEDAVNTYLAGILYGGTFNRTKLTDAIQAAEGVVDLILGDIMAKRASLQKFEKVEGNNYKSIGGSFRSVDLRNTISYVLEV